MKLLLRTLSPLHIGTGEELAPLDYVAYDGQFYRVPQQKFMEFVERKLPDGPNQFAAWVSEKLATMREVRDNRVLSDLEGEMSPYHFCKSIGQERLFLDFLRAKESGVFSAPVILDQRMRQRARGAKVVSLNRVREAIKNGGQRPLVPGTSIKGALRTAVLYHYLTKHVDTKKIENMVIDNLKDRRARKERFALSIVQEAFYCHAENSFKKLKTDDEKMDLFKLVQVADGHVKDSDQPLSLAKINIYLVEKKVSRDRSKSYFEATQQPQASYCENIVPDTIVETNIDIDIDFLLRVKSMLRDGAVPTSNGRQWIGIEGKVKQLFNLDLQSLTFENKEQKRKEVIDHLLACVRIFSQEQLKAHRLWLDHFEKNDPHDDFSSRIRQGFAPVFSKDQNTLVHLGYATGFDGMTALLYFLADDRRKGLFKEVMERFGLGNRPGNKGRYKANPDRFPKSKRLVETNDSIQPMGWVEVFGEHDEIEPLSTDHEVAEESIQETKEPVPPAEPEFFSATINYKKPPELDAIVVKSGRPNKVKVYLAADKQPVLDLQNYRSPLDEGTVIIVQSDFNKKRELLKVAFRRLK